MRQARSFLSARYWSMCVFFKIVLTVGFCIVLAKSFMLQVLDHDAWVERARNQSEATVCVPTYRGSVYDNQGRLMAYSVPQSSLFADCEEMGSEQELGNAAARLSPVLGESEASVRKKLVKGRRFCWIKRYLTDQQASAVSRLDIKGLHFLTEYKRFYPHRQLAGQVLGFVGTDGTGLEGIEKACDDILKEDPRTMEQLRDGVKNRLWLKDSSPEEPAEKSSIRLTLDGYIQYVAECELEKTVNQYRAKGGEVVVMDPSTFEVLAMANWPAFDPNTNERESSRVWRNRTVCDLFEPGSTFKVFMVAAALEERTAREGDRIFCENGKFKMAGHMINDVHHYGWLTVSEVIKYSSNIGAGKIAMQLGRERYYRYIRAFGFGETGGVGLPGEAKGLLRPCSKWRPIDLVTISFGQSVGVSSLQLTAAVSSIGNKGRYIQPAIVKEVVASGVRRMVDPDRESRQVVSPKTAEKVAAMMALVTQEGGTGVGAAIPGYTVAGKTGTAQKVDPATRRYSSSRYTSVFTGFVPVNNPRLAITVVIHEPQGAIYGGVVAAPVFRNIAVQALPYLRVPATGTDHAPVSGLRLANTSASPAAVAPVLNTLREEPMTTGPDGVEDPDLMPDLTGLSLKTAMKQLARFKVQMKCKGSGVVVKQKPLPGAPMKSGGVVELALNESPG